MSGSKKCEICSREANFSCSQCDSVFYCSKDHQIEHWKASHKNNCRIVVEENSAKLEKLITKRYSCRKQYFENYANKIFDLCLLDAKVLVDFDRQILAITGDTKDQYEYGASVCLLARTHLLIKDLEGARNVLQKYLFENSEFLSSLEVVPDINDNFSIEQRDSFLKKMNLLSTIGNLSHALELDAIKYYVIYTKHVEQMFGNDSLEVSNCYFLIGCYFAEKGFLRKAIACFMKSAACRKQMAGDCYFNIGVLYLIQKKYPKALEMFEEAMTLREQQYGEDSDEIAEILENVGYIYAEVNDFITAMIEYEKAFKIRASNPYSPEYRNVLDLIHELYDKLSLFVNEEHDGLKKPAIFLHLKAKIEDEEVYWKDRINKREGISKEKMEESSSKKPNNGEEPAIPPGEKKPHKGEAVLEDHEKSDKNDHLLKITEDLISELNPTELYLLSDLQIEISTCESLFAQLSVIGGSQFLKRLSPANMEVLKSHNRELFKLLQLEFLERRDKK